MDNTYDSLHYHKGDTIAGIDEAGVSDIAGPLVSACVILPRVNIGRDDLSIFMVDDSKKVPHCLQRKLAETVIQVAVGFGIGEVTPLEMDYLTKHEALSLAMFRAVAACKDTARGQVIVPDYLLIDGEIKAPVNIKQECLIKGDEKSLSIAAASIVAKVYRNGIMDKLHETYPYYGWNSNKGFPTKAHFDGLDNHGVIIGIHRQRFWPFRSNKAKEEAPEWQTRRQAWRKKTLETLAIGADKTLWSSEENSTAHSLHSKPTVKKEALLGKSGARQGLS